MNPVIFLTQHTQGQASKSDPHCIAPLKVVHVHAGQHAQSWGQRESSGQVRLAGTMIGGVGQGRGCTPLKAAWAFAGCYLLADWAVWVHRLLQPGRLKSKKALGVSVSIVPR